MEAPGASDLRRDLIMASSDMASSHGRNLLRFWNRGAPRRHIVIIRSSSDERHWIHHERTIVEIIIRGSSSDGGSRSTKNHDRCTIVAQSSLDRGTIVAHSAKNGEPRPLQTMDHDRRAIVAINPLPRPHQTA